MCNVCVRFVSQCKSNIASLFCLWFAFCCCLPSIQMSMYFSYWLDIYLLIENATELFKSCGKAFIVSISLVKTPGRWVFGVFFSFPRRIVLKSFPWCESIHSHAVNRFRAYEVDRSDWNESVWTHVQCRIVNAQSDTKNIKSNVYKWKNNGYLENFGSFFFKSKMEKVYLVNFNLLSRI